jgi:hypothetical protein
MRYKQIVVMADADCYPVRAQVSMAEGGEAAEGSKQLQEKGPQSVSFAPSRGTSLPGGSTNVVGSQTKRIGTIQPPPDIRAIVVRSIATALPPPWLPIDAGSAPPSSLLIAAQNRSVCCSQWPGI